ncbi:MAG TPA: ATP-dependent RNA helicase HrpA [Steroidobacteraceae bacterium]|jgi:ATP-dependent helicase HrpA|nr:ATP-dependent RNA helicase HrpA [Steroidobacteraceae bacterium]
MHPSLNLAPDPTLPISAHAADIAAAVASHPVIIVCGATGSGKSTQLPKLCLAAGRGTAGIIGHTQPRRIAARALANRIAAELGTRVGAAVGCQVRFEDRTGPDCRIKLMTDGILLRQLTFDPYLSVYDTVIIDEAHERSLNIDLLLGSLKRLCARRPELRVIVTSATIDTQRLAEFFDGAPVIDIEGSSHPVEVRYRPLAAPDEDAAELSLPEGIVAAVRELSAADVAPAGDILVFLPGEKHIREAALALQRARLPRLEVMPLFARLTAQQQERIFAAHSTRRVILATNVAETSLTVPQVRHVIDSGLARISRYSVRNKVQRLPLEPVSQASANQRRGRCGREAPGICIRLYSEEDFAARAPFTPPEILRTHLASVLLQMAASQLGDPEDFPFPDPPDTRQINDGVRQLQELGAMDERRRITSVGRRIATLPCDPKLGRMLLAAARLRCLAEVLIITALLAAQDPRERPADTQSQADEAHASYADARSDFVTVLRLWQRFHDQAATLGGAALRKWCRENFLSFVRMREWQDLHGQLSASANDLGLKRNATPASHADLHRALLCGLLGSIGLLDERREYLGARGTRFVIAPGTPLAAKPPKWVVAAHLLETTRLYARMVAAVQPGWIEGVAGHLLRREYSDPHWVSARGQVSAYEAVSLYGLPLASARRISYGAVAPTAAHEIFVQEALVAGRSSIAAPFVAANRDLKAHVEALEARIRRRDILVDEATQARFYATRIPSQVNSVAGFESWWQQRSRTDPEALHMRLTDLSRREAPEAGAEFFPQAMNIAGNDLPLSYVFDPGAPGDGITLNVPAQLLEELDAEQLAWLVSGVRREKIAELLRSLPKPIRRQLVPVTDNANLALESLGAGPQPPFHSWLAGWITVRAGTPVKAADLAAAVLPDHLRLNVRVLDGAQVLGEARDLAQLRRRLRAGARTAAPDAWRAWDFGPLPQLRTVERSGVSFKVWPALCDTGSAVLVVEARSLAQAQELLRAGLMRLAVLALPQLARYIARRISDDRTLILLAQGLSGSRPLAQATTERIFQECFFDAAHELPRDAPAFALRLQERRALLEATATRIIATLRSILEERRAARAAVEGLHGEVFAAAVAQMGAQLGALLEADFPATPEQPWFNQLPRYLKAISRRASRMRTNLERDAALAARVRPFEAQYRSLSEHGVALAVAPALRQLRWMLEEFRVSLHAQELRTLLPVSEQRLHEQIERILHPATPR